MRIREFILIVVMKMFAIIVIVVGIFCEAHNGCSLGNFLVTIGSLGFAIASNTTLFIYTSLARKRRKGGTTRERSNTKSIDCCPASGPFPINTDDQGGAGFAVRFARKESGQHG